MFSYLINECDKTIVETLDLLFLLVANHLDVGVDVDVYRGEQALVDGHGFNGSPLIIPAAHPGDGVGSHGHAAEAP